VGALIVGAPCLSRMTLTGAESHAMAIEPSSAGIADRAADISHKKMPTPLTTSNPAQMINIGQMRARVTREAIVGISAFMAGLQIVGGRFANDNSLQPSGLDEEELLPLSLMENASPMICVYCEAPMPEISSFCPACGRSVHAEEWQSHDAQARALASLAYVALVPAIIFLFVPSLRADRFVRFHSWQSVLYFVAAVVFALILRLLFVVLSLLPFIGSLVAWLSLGIGALGIFMLWITLLLKAAQGSALELPLIGPLAARLTSNA
jgi:uncharacterized membrane protein